VRDVDIEEFYDEDQRRRESAEVELGTEWRDARGVRYELNWVEETGELYVMREPPPPAWEGPFGDIHVRTGKRAPIEGMTVQVVAHIRSHEELERVLDGWQAAMAGPEGVEWLARRLRESGTADPAWADTGG
jgi:hypothetical protein